MNETPFTHKAECFHSLNEQNIFSLASLQMKESFQTAVPQRLGRAVMGFRVLGQRNPWCCLCLPIYLGSCGLPSLVRACQQFLFFCSVFHRLECKSVSVQVCPLEQIVQYGRLQPHVIISVYLSLLFFLFSHTMWLVGSQISDQGLNLFKKKKIEVFVATLCGASLLAPSFQQHFLTLFLSVTFW